MDCGWCLLHAPSPAWCFHMFTRDGTTWTHSKNAERDERGNHLLLVGGLGRLATQHASRSGRHPSGVPSSLARAHLRTCFTGGHDMSQWELMQWQSFAREHRRHDDRDRAALLAIRLSGVVPSSLMVTAPKSLIDVGAFVHTQPPYDLAPKSHTCRASRRLHGQSLLSATSYWSCQLVPSPEDTPQSKSARYLVLCCAVLCWPASHLGAVHSGGGMQTARLGMSDRPGNVRKFRPADRFPSHATSVILCQKHSVPEIILTVVATAQCARGKVTSLPRIVAVCHVTSEQWLPTHESPPETQIEHCCLVVEQCGLAAFVEEEGPVVPLGCNHACTRTSAPEIIDIPGTASILPYLSSNTFNAAPRRPGPSNATTTPNAGHLRRFEADEHLLALVYLLIPILGDVLATLVRPESIIIVEAFFHTPRSPSQRRRQRHNAEEDRGYLLIPMLTVFHAVKASLSPTRLRCLLNVVLLAASISHSKILHLPLSTNNTAKITLWSFSLHFIPHHQTVCHTQRELADTEVNTHKSIAITLKTFPTSLSPSLVSCEGKPLASATRQEPRRLLRAQTNLTDTNTTALCEGKPLCSASDASATRQEPRRLLRAQTNLTDANTTALCEGKPLCSASEATQTFESADEPHWRQYNSPLRRKAALQRLLSSSEKLGVQLPLQHLTKNISAHRYASATCFKSRHIKRLRFLRVKMTLPITEQIWQDAGLNSGTSLATGPALLLQNNTFYFFCQTLKALNKKEQVKNHRQQAKNYKNNVPRQLFTTLTKPLFDLASKTRPDFPKLPKLAIMHVHNRTNQELLRLLGMHVKFEVKKDYDESGTGVSAVVTVPQISPIPHYSEYTDNGPQGVKNTHHFLSQKAMQHRDGGLQFLEAVETYLIHNPQQSPLAQYFPVQQQLPQQQPPPQPIGSQAISFAVAAPNPPANVGVPQVSQPVPAAVNHPAQQVQLQQAIGSQAATFNTAAPNAHANFGASQANRYDEHSQRMMQFLGHSQPGWDQAEPFNYMAPNAPVNSGAAQPYQAAMLIPTQQMQAPQPDMGQADPAAMTLPSASMDQESLDFAAPPGCINLGVPQVYAGNAGMDFPPQDWQTPLSDMDQGAPFNSQTFLPYPPQGFDEVDEIAPLTDAELLAYQAQLPDQGAQFPAVDMSTTAHAGVEQDNQNLVEEAAWMSWDDEFQNNFAELAESFGIPDALEGLALDGSAMEQFAMPPQPQPSQAAQVTSPEPREAQEFGGDKTLEQTPPASVTEFPTPMFMDIGAEEDAFQSSSSIFDEFIDWDAPTWHFRGVLFNSPASSCRSQQLYDQALTTLMKVRPNICGRITSAACLSCKIAAPTPATAQIETITIWTHNQNQNQRTAGTNLTHAGGRFFTTTHLPWIILQIQLDLRTQQNQTMSQSSLMPEGASSLPCLPWISSQIQLDLSQQSEPSHVRPEHPLFAMARILDRLRQRSGSAAILRHTDRGRNHISCGMCSHGQRRAMIENRGGNECGKLCRHGFGWVGILMDCLLVFKLVGDGFWDMDWKGRRLDSCWREIEEGSLLVVKQRTAISHKKLSCEASRLAAGRRYTPPFSAILHLNWYWNSASYLLGHGVVVFLPNARRLQSNPLSSRLTVFLLIFLLPYPRHTVQESPPVFAHKCPSRQSKHNNTYQPPFSPSTCHVQRTTSTSHHMLNRITSLGKKRSPPRSFSVSRPAQPSSPYPGQELRSPTAFSAPDTPRSVHSTTGLLQDNANLPPPPQYNPQRPPARRREPLCERYLLFVVVIWAVAVTGWVVWLYVRKAWWYSKEWTSK
ncbi:uncharacterized protein MYCFIDRAFT_173767 [Pseudocercospora fijiensis CIRAD86]|uniref:Uncharacterized protein n=1 Tax=Pseudocercospora fijiensis (strain CIRAD86) TaxID=383855 RepID=M3A136_PSEFD|nr:uncharacterized protein MYCFIDRAFT_173767 [Pseudocercospora fijiensis CIRAD86]EME84864.1 hypothetical protein MYCFIDRAFT_173767 [Pseudocercospora fijiensis CIRAD86]